MEGSSRANWDLNSHMFLLIYGLQFFFNFQDNGLQNKPCSWERRRRGIYLFKMHKKNGRKRVKMLNNEWQCEVGPTWLEWRITFGDAWGTATMEATRHTERWVPTRKWAQSDWAEQVGKDGGEWRARAIRAKTEGDSSWGTRGPYMDEGGRGIQTWRQRQFERYHTCDPCERR